MGAICCS